MTCFGLPITSSANDTFSNTVLSCSSLKSWNTVPRLRRSFGTPLQAESFARFLPATKTSPCVGSSSRSNKRRDEDLPDPDGPTRKTNSPFSISMETSSRAVTSFLYVFETCCRLIMRFGMRGSGRDHPSRGLSQFRGGSSADLHTHYG